MATRLLLILFALVALSGCMVDLCQANPKPDWCPAQSKPGKP